MLKFAIMIAAAGLLNDCKSADPGAGDSEVRGGGGPPRYDRRVVVPQGISCDTGDVKIEISADYPICSATGSQPRTDGAEHTCFPPYLIRVTYNKGGLKWDHREMLANIVAAYLGDDTSTPGRAPEFQQIEIVSRKNRHAVGSPNYYKDFQMRRTAEMSGYDIFIMGHRVGTDVCGEEFKGIVTTSEFGSTCQMWQWNPQTRERTHEDESAFQ
jgi:hypothetical protein